MNAQKIIIKKRDGEELSRDEIRFFVESCVGGSMPSYQLSAFLMAVFLNGLTTEETVHLTQAMIESGETLSFEFPRERLVDKHSTGGVGDKVSLVLLPIAVECGLGVPMVSGRSLGFTGGTLDKLESIPGMRTSLSTEEMIAQVEELGGCFAGQTDELAPADRVMYAMRDATGTVESLPLIVSSILSKKAAEGVRGVVIDVKCGRGAFMEKLEDARRLASMLEEVGRGLGLKVRCILSSMEQPLGRAVGNALEVAESLEMLMGQDAAPDLGALTHRLVGEMLVVGGVAGDVEEGMERSKSVLSSGGALERFIKIVEAQGGRIDPDGENYGLPLARHIDVVESEIDGYVEGIDARLVGETLRRMGGGRFRVDDAVDPACGFVFLRKTGERVGKGEPICEVHASSEEALSIGLEAMKEAVKVEPGTPGHGFSGGDATGKSPSGGDVIIS